MYKYISILVANFGKQIFQLILIQGGVVKKIATIFFKSQISILSTFENFLMVYSKVCINMLTGKYAIKWFTIKHALTVYCKVCNNLSYFDQKV